MNDKNENTDNNNTELKTIDKGKLDISFPKNFEQNSNNKSIPKKTLLRRKSTLKRRLFIKPDFIEQLLNKEIVNSFNFDKTDPDLRKLLMILTETYNRRIKKDNEFIFSFLTKIKMQEIIKTDLLESNLTWEELFSIIKQYIFGKIYNFYDTLYYTGNESNLLYIIVHGKIGRYNLVEFSKIVSCEEYLLFINKCYLRYQKMLNEGPIDENKESDNDKNKKNKDKTKMNYNEEEEEEKDEFELNDDEYIDEYLLNQIIEKNKEMYPLHSINDIDKLNTIIFKIKLYSALSEGKSSDAIDLFEKYRFPITYLGYDRVIDREVTQQLFLQKLYKNLGSKGRYYMKLLSSIPQTVKIMKFVKKDILSPFSFFGNFEIIECTPKRKYTARCESEKCIVIGIDKKMYSSILYEIQKDTREKEVNKFHTNYLFKNINIHYFTTKIFSQFKIHNLFKGDVIFNQDENLNHFVLVKEGIIELSLQNMSFFELNQLIKKVREILIICARKYMIDLNELFNFNTYVDTKTTIKFNIIKEELHRKQNFIFSNSQKGFFGDYELFFGIPSLLTGIVASDVCKVYYYDFDDYKNLNEETYILNESLKQTSFFKLKAILKRIINVYNSYWKRCHDILNKKEIENEEIINMKNNEEMEMNLKKKIKYFEPNSPVKINPNIKDIYLSHTSNNNSTDFNISKDEEIESIIKLYLNNNNNANSKFFRTSLDLIKAKFKSQNSQNINSNTHINKTKTHNIILKDELPHMNNISKLKTIISHNIENENIYKRSLNNIMKKINNIKLMKEFKRTIDAQRVARKKQKKKIFLPPILKISGNIYNYPIFKTESGYKNKNLEHSYSRDSINSIDKSNKSIKNRSTSKDKKIKTKKIKTLNLKVAQFNVMRYRIEQIQKRNPKLYRSNLNNSK